MENKYECVETKFGDFHTLKNDLATDQLKQYSAHTRNEIAMLISIIREGDTLLDIGAHIGTFAIPIAKHFKGDIQIFSFEPQQEIFTLLEKNVKQNQVEGAITCLNGLVSNEQKRFSAPVVVEGNSMDAAFLPTKKKSGNDGKSEYTIDVFVIDEMVKNKIIPEKVDVIKMDTEGAEKTVLQSCESLISKNLPVIYGEINVPALARFKTSPKEIEQFLSTFGYHFFRNIGRRNSDNDEFKIARLNSIREGGRFYDFLAVHPDDDRYPATDTDARLLAGLAGGFYQSLCGRDQHNRA